MKIAVKWLHLPKRCLQQLFKPHNHNTPEILTSPATALRMQTKKWCQTWTHSTVSERYEKALMHT